MLRKIDDPFYFDDKGRVCSHTFYFREDRSGGLHRVENFSGTAGVVRLEPRRAIIGMGWPQGPVWVEEKETKPS